MNMKLNSFLEGLYYTYQRRELINPDPLHFLYDYDDVKDLEISGLVASSLAYGRVSQIMKSVDKVLSCLTDKPGEFLLHNKNFHVVPESFKHRFTTGHDVNILLKNAAEILREYGSLEEFLGKCLRDSAGNIFSALDEFSERLSRGRAAGSFSLVTAPKDGSACKRLFLFLKWLVRHDDVDPGGWKVLRPADLIVPTDTHMHNIAMKLGFTKRKNADLKCAVEITDGFREICPEDPAKYDFVLTRFGIRAGLDVNEITELFTSSQETQESLPESQRC
ncbi:MAG: TIGR02757 family protein [Synergistaceae bacterium]|nr:TIGR02757 family protein [Synergistaceae bacterium]